MNNEKKINDLFLFGGFELEEIYNQHKQENDTYKQVVDKLKGHFNPKANIQLNRFTFRNQEQYEEESFDDYVTRVKEVAKTCGFEKEDEEITSQVIQRCRSDKLKAKAISDGTTELAKLVNMGRLDESISVQLKQLSVNKSTGLTDDEQFKSLRDARVNAVKNVSFSNLSKKHIQSDATENFKSFGQQSYRNEGSKQGGSSQYSTNKRKCKYCSYDFPHRNGADCPAKGAQCRKCGLLNHYERCCPKKGSVSIKNIEVENDSSDDCAEQAYG